MTLAVRVALNPNTTYNQQLDGGTYLNALCLFVWFCTL